MPFGGNDWLALTQETTMEPDLPICDPHHHFYFRRLDRMPYHNYHIEDLYGRRFIRRPEQRPQCRLHRVCRGQAHVSSEWSGRDASGG